MLPVVESAVRSILAELATVPVRLDEQPDEVWGFNLFSVLQVRTGSPVVYVVVLLEWALGPSVRESG